MPAEQLACEQTRTQMGIPADLTFKTKPEFGVDPLTDTIDGGVPVSWCALPLRLGGVRRVGAGPLCGQVLAGVGHPGCALPGTNEHTALRRYDATATGWDRYCLAHVDVYDFSSDPPQPFIINGTFVQP